jgi:hypothetical protein
VAPNQLLMADCTYVKLATKATPSTQRFPTVSPARSTPA